MKSDISEFSFGFALVNELVTHYHLASAAPEFPNLRQEGHVGYDVRLKNGGIPVFLQFKLSDVMLRGTAKAAGKLGIPHYRAALRPRRHSKQHQLLLTLESTKVAVFYAAPMFHKASDLDHAFAYRNVVARTAFFRPRDIGSLPDDDDHSLSFVQSHHNAWFFSEPKELQRYDGINLFREWLRAGITSDQRIPETLTPEVLVQRMVSVLATADMPVTPLDNVLSGPDSWAVRALLIARFYFASELLFV
jgi:hypothetical protein